MKCGPDRWWKLTGFRRTLPTRLASRHLDVEAEAPISSISIVRSILAEFTEALMLPL